MSTHLKNKILYFKLFHLISDISNKTAKNKGGGEI